MLIKKVLTSEEKLKEDLVKGTIRKKDAAAEIVSWLRKAEWSSLGFMVAPLISSIFVVFDARLGMVLPFLCAVVGAWIYRKVTVEKKRLQQEYDIPVIKW